MWTTARRWTCGIACCSPRGPTWPAYVQGLSAYVALAPDDTEFHDRLAVVKDKVDAPTPARKQSRLHRAEARPRAVSRNDLAAADPLLTRAAQARSDDAEAVGGLGLLRMREGRRDEAQQLFQRARATRARQSSRSGSGLAQTAQFWATLTRARQAAAAGRPDEAARLAREALAMNVSIPTPSWCSPTRLLAQKVGERRALAEGIAERPRSEPRDGAQHRDAVRQHRPRRTHRAAAGCRAKPLRARRRIARNSRRFARTILVAQAERLSQQGLRAGNRPLRSGAARSTGFAVDAFRARSHLPRSRPAATQPAR